MYSINPPLMRQTVIFLFCSIYFYVHSQQDAQFALSFYNPLGYNSAYAGTRESISIMAVSRFQWTGMNGAPQTHEFSVHSPVLLGKMGLGGAVQMDALGNRNRISSFFQLATHLAISDMDHVLSVGLDIGGDQISTQFQQAVVQNPNDPFVQSNPSYFLPNVGAGLYFHHPTYYIGFSIPRAIEFNQHSNEFKQNIIKRHMYLSGGLVRELSETVDLRSNFLLKYVAGSPINLDVSVHGIFHDRLWGGINYRFREGIGFNVIVTLPQSFRIGYTFEHSLNGLRQFHHGTHEFALLWDFNSQKGIISSPRYF
jgi:type IX secretion system PorP/SprF family membrane protein